MPEHCQPHPYFGLIEMLWSFMLPTLVVAAIFILLGGASWIWSRSRAGPVVLACGVLMVAGCLGDIDRAVLRWLFGAGDFARLQRELQMREADLARYGVEHPGWSNSQIVKGFLSTNGRPNGFYFSEPAVQPLFFKVSDWRDEIPRVVVSFGCSNNMVFDSMTMKIEQLD